MEKFKHNKGLFVAVIFHEPTIESFQTYIINDSDVHYTGVGMTIGGNISQDDDPPIPMGTAQGGLGELGPRSYLHVEKNDIDFLDYKLWTHFKFTPRDGKSFKKWYEIGGLSFVIRYEDNSQMIPILDKVGVIVELWDLDR